jgi:hypothetical protein
MKGDEIRGYVPRMREGKKTITLLAGKPKGKKSILKF